jgi:hypothetical protein
MKNIFISLFLVILLSAPLSTIAEPTNTKSFILSSNTIESLLIGLKSQNLGLKTSAAFMLGELDVKSAVVPLMRVMRNDKSDEAKIMAALALYKLGTPMSINALLQASRFENSERVKKMCSRFYFDYISRQKISEI